MSEAPELKPHDEIYIGNGVRAIVSCVFSEPHPDGAVAEVVHMDAHKAVNSDIAWIEDHWTFVGPDFGGYADGKDRLRPFVTKLRYGGARPR